MATAKKPMTLRAAVKACDLEAVQGALARLGDNAKAALDATDGAGRTMLHTCASNANKESAGEIARLLVLQGAGINTPDLAGQVPLAIVVSISIELPEASSPPALITIRKLLEARASVDVVDEWRSESGPLAAAAQTPAGDAVCALLQVHGTKLPWLQQDGATPNPDEANIAPPAAQNFDPPPRTTEPDDRPDDVMDAEHVPNAEACSALEVECAEYNIPFALLGKYYAEELLKECLHWQKTSVKELRQKCQSQGLSTSGCVEKGDLVSRLRDALVKTYVAQRKAEADAPADPAPGPDAEAEEDGDLSEMFVEAIDRLDLAKVQKVIDKVRQIEGDSGVEDIVLSFDIDGNTPIHKCVSGSATGEAVSESDMEKIVDLLIEAQADVNQQNLLGESPLLSASRSTSGLAGQAPLGIIRSLLAANADTECADELAGETCLMEAACRGDVCLCRLLLDAKADLSRANSHGLTALDMAADNGHAHARAFLRGRGASRGAASPEEPPAPSEKLAVAVRSGDLDTVQDELENLGRDVDAMLDAVDDNGWTLLHMCAACAAQDGAGEIARLLIQYEAAVDVEDSFGQVPLVLAVSAGIEDQESSFAVLDVIRVLLVAGASMDSMDEEWRSENSDLATSASTPSGKAICKLLMAFGMDFPWCAASPSSPCAASDKPESPMAAEAEESLEVRCNEQNIPLEKLGRAEAAEALRECDRWRGMSVKELRNECKSVHVPTDGCVEKNDLVSRLRQVAIWHAMSSELLRTECRERGIATAVKASRDELEDALLVGVWGGTSRKDLVKERCAAKGIPVDLCESPPKAAEVLNKVEQMESSSIGEVKKEYSKWGLPIEAGMEKQDMVSRLRSLIIWAELSDTALRQLCKQKGVPPTALNANSSREDFIKCLAEANGMPVPAPRHKNFFSYGNQPDNSGASQSPNSNQSKKPAPNRPLTEEEQAAMDWEARAEYNRQQFAKGNRNHAGMPGGMRNSGGAAFRAGASRPTQSGRPGGQRPPPPPSVPSVSAHFKKLGLPPTASMIEVRKVYRKLALQYHPDKNPGPLREAAEKKFQEVQASYDKVCEHFRAKEGKQKPQD